MVLQHPPSTHYKPRIEHSRTFKNALVIKQDWNPKDVISNCILEVLLILGFSDVNSLMQTVPDDYGFEVVAGLLQATGHAIAVKRIEKVKRDDLSRRLAELKTYRSTRMITRLSDTDSARSNIEKKVA
nr:hypothetical protein [Tanacetum cinerariifolium]